MTLHDVVTRLNVSPATARRLAVRLSQAQPPLARRVRRGLDGWRWEVDPAAVERIAALQGGV